MQITDIRAMQSTTRLDCPQRNARGSRNERTFAFVVVETDAGLTGLGDAYGDQALMPTIIERRLRPMAIGLDPSNIDAVWCRLFASRAFGRSAAQCCAASAPSKWPAGISVSTRKGSPSATSPAGSAWPRRFIRCPHCRARMDGVRSDRHAGVVGALHRPGRLAFRAPGHSRLRRGHLALALANAEAAGVKIAGCVVADRTELERLQHFDDEIRLQAAEPVAGPLHKESGQSFPMCRSCVKRLRRMPADQ